jgi:hypothetical protein
MIHFLPLPPKQKRRCDTRALLEARATVHRRLRMEIEEEELSQEITDRHNAKLLRSQHFRQHGEI